MTDEVLAAEIVDDAHSPIIEDDGLGDDGLIGAGFGNAMGAMRRDNPAAFWGLISGLVALIVIAASITAWAYNLPPVASLSITLDLEDDVNMEVIMLAGNSLRPGGVEGEMVDMEVLYYDDNGDSTVMFEKQVEVSPDLVGEYPDATQIEIAVDDFYAGNGYVATTRSHYAVRVSTDGVDSVEQILGTTLFKTPNNLLMIPCEWTGDAGLELQFQLSFDTPGANGSAVHNRLVTQGGLEFLIQYWRGDENDNNQTDDEEFDDIFSGAVDVNDRDQVVASPFVLEEPSDDDGSFFYYTYRLRVPRDSFYDTNEDGDYRIIASFNPDSSYEDSRVSNPADVQSPIARLNLDDAGEGTPCDF